MPAAAVIPAPIAYINVAAVEKLVVGTRVSGGGFRRPPAYCSSRPFWRAAMGALN